MEDQPIENKVAKSGLITLEISQFNVKYDAVELDLKDQLWQGIALREKEFRTFLKEYNWSELENKTVIVYCSADAIIPNWAYMLLASSLPQSTEVYFNYPIEVKKIKALEAIEQMETESYKDQRVIVKGCGSDEIDFSAYGALTRKLKPIVKNLMFGEPCSTVPILKN